MKFVETSILKASILIVDDQESNVSLLEQVLRDAGYTGVSSTIVTVRPPSVTSARLPT